MNTVLLTNETTTKTWHRLDRTLHKSDIVSMRLAVSYLMKSGAELVRRRLEKLASDSVPIEIVFGDDMGISESQALRILSDTGCSLFVYRGVNRYYHPKMWLIVHAGGNRTIYIGSSNLSDSGLKNNVEAGLLIEGKEEETREFDTLWQSIRGASVEVDDDFISSYKNIEDENRIKFRFKKNGKPDLDGNTSALQGFLTGWMQYIANPEIKGRTEKWRGWYLLPSQGTVTVTKLRELARVLAAIGRSPHYQRSGFLDISPTTTGIDNVNRMIKEARITYASRHARPYRRDLFIRQQKNYLERLGFIEELSRSRITITARGLQLSASSSPSDLRDVFSRSLDTIFWSHGNIHFYPFLVDLISRMPDKRIYQSEVDLFVIHTYHQSQIDNRAEIVNMFRSLRAAERANLYRWAHSQLDSLLRTHRNASAHGHYKGKVYELMVAFGCTSQLKYVEKDNPMNSYLTMRT